MLRKLINQIDRVMFKVMPSCKDAMELHSRAIDEGLPLHRRFLLKMHCQMCCYCERYGEQLRWLHQKLRQFPSQLDFSKVRTMPEDMRERIRGGGKQ